MPPPPDAPHRDFRLYVGTVVEDIDPTRMGRVQVRIPGLIDPGAWARTLHPGSPLSRGMFAVPSLGAEVCVAFLGGELDSPVVLGGFVPPLGTQGPRNAAAQGWDSPRATARTMWIMNSNWTMVFGPGNVRVEPEATALAPAGAAPGSIGSLGTVEVPFDTRDPGFIVGDVFAIIHQPELTSFTAAPPGVTPTFFDSNGVGFVLQESLEQATGIPVAEEHRLVLSAQTGVTEVRAPVAVRVNSPGAVTTTAPVIELNGRPVQRGRRPI